MGPHKLRQEAKLALGPAEVHHKEARRLAVDPEKVADLRLPLGVVSQANPAEPQLQ